MFACICWINWWHIELQHNLSQVIFPPLPDPELCCLIDKSLTLQYLTVALCEFSWSSHHVKPYPVAVTAKTSLPPERPFTAFSCLCFRLTKLFASMESFRKAYRITSTLGFSVATPCLCLMIATHSNRTCHFSPFGMLHSWPNKLYLEINSFCAGFHFYS